MLMELSAMLEMFVSVLLHKRAASHMWLPNNLNTATMSKELDFQFK